MARGERHRAIPPRARKERIITQVLDDELLVYDLDRHQAHCLNRAAAHVWNCCNGIRTTSEIAAGLPRGAELPADESIVWLALKQLSTAGLLEERMNRPWLNQLESRREVLKRIKIAAIALPLVATILAPTAANAASCAALGQSCTTLPCCAGLMCAGGVCV